MNQYENTDSQGELFNEICSETLANLDGSSSSLKTKQPFKLTLEKFLILIILLIIVGVISYIFGYNKGIQSSPQKQELVTTEEYVVVDTGAEVISEVSESIVSDDSYSLAEESSASLSEEVVQREVAEVDEGLHVDSGNWTIQLVTYTSEQYAIKEVTRLKTEGLDAFIIPSGKFHQVCSNRFAEKNDANKVLKKFKSGSRYRDAYIRKITK